MLFITRHARMVAGIILFTAAALGLKHFLSSLETASFDHPEVNSSALATKAKPVAIRQPDVVNAASRSRAVEAYGRLPLRFEANQGQAAAPAKFISRNSGFTLSLATDEAAIHLRGTEEAKTPATVKMKFVNANANARIDGSDRIESVSNYFIGGDAKRWRTGIANFGKVRQQAVWPGIDVVWYGTGRQLEHDFVIAPGADPRRIKLAFSGTGGTSIDAEGALKLRTEVGDLRLLRPVAWQVSDGRREEIVCNYRINTESQAEFQLGEYDKGKELVIDPVITLATWFGGSESDEARSIAVDKTGAAYITGTAVSVDFPTAGPVQQNKAALVDAFVLKLSPDGQQIVYATYLGGGGVDQAFSVAIDDSGNAYVAGATFSTDFPTTPGALQTSLKGITDGFITKLNASGSALLWSTYIGGDAVDGTNDLAVDGAGNVYFTGRTTSSDLPANGFQARRSGSSVYKSSNSGGAWNVSGAGLAGAITYGLTIDPSNASVMYAATDFGVYKSIDGGGKWRATPFTGVAYDVAVDPGNASTIYVAGSGQFAKSINGGESFTFKSSQQNFSSSNAVYTVLPVPANAQTPATIYVGTERAVFKSVDGGETWTASFLLGSIGLNVRVTRLIADPNNPATIFAGTDRGVFKSVNAGVNWSLVLAGQAFDGFSNSDIFPGVRALTMDPAQPATIFAGLNNTGSVYKSTNGGMTWNRSDAGIGDGNQIVRINDLAVGASQTVFASTVAGIYRSLDAGANWSLANDGLKNLFALPLAIDRNNPATVYAGTISGADAYAAKLNATGSALSWLTYLGGALNDDGAAIAIDGEGNSYVTGTAFGSDFPVFNQMQNFGGGTSDAFVTKINPAGTGLVWSTFLGNAENENGFDIAVNSSGEVYVVGSSSPTAGLREAYIRKIRADGASLAWSRTFGGNNPDDAFAVALGPEGNPFVTGVTESADFFPLINASQTKLNLSGSTGATDAFVIGFEAVGGEAIWATYLGGSRSERGNGIAVDARGNIYVVGGTASIDFPAVNSTPQPVRNGDALLVKFTPTADLAVTMTDLPDPVMVNQNLTYTVTVANNGTDTALGVSLTDTLPAGVSLVSVTPSQGSCNGAGTVVCTLGNLAVTTSATVSIVVKPAATGTITNRASVSSITSDPDPANNSAMHETVVGNASSIFGRVTTSAGAAISGVTMTLSGTANATMTTRADGGFQFANLTAGGNYTLMPSLSGYVFTPASQSVGNLTSDQQVNFTAIACVFSIVPFKQSFPATGGSGSVAVACEDQRCTWTARSNVPWVRITSATSGTGNSTLSFDVAPTIGSRIGTLTIAGNTFTVMQEFNPCAAAEFRNNAPTILPPGEASANFALGDFNADGRLDMAFLIANSDQAPRVTLSLTSSSGAIGTPVKIYTGPLNETIRTVHAGDFNGDGAADLALTASDPSGSNGRIIVMLSQGGSGFAPPTTYGVGPSPRAAVVRDFNNDGRFDIAATTGPPGGNPGPVPQSQNVSMLPGDGTGGFGAVINSSVTISAQGLARMAAGDFNNDGKLDLALVGFLGSLITLQGDGTGKFTALSGFEFFTGGIRGIAVGDFNNDRRADVMTSTGSVLFTGANGGLEPPRSIAGVSGASVIAGDFNGDGKTDAAFGDAVLTTFLFSRGNGEFDSPVSYLNGLATVSGFLPVVTAAIGDYNRDGRQDLVIAGNPPNASQNLFAVTVMVAGGNGEFDAPRNFPFGVKFPGEQTEGGGAFDAKAADFNGDSLSDLAVAYSQDKVSILFGNGRGGFSAPVGYRTAELSNILTVRDFTNDGKPDLVALSPSLGRVTLLINDGAGRFPQTKSFATGSSPLAMAIEDFNGDGNADIVVKGASGGLSLFAGDGAGNFAERTSGLASEFTSARFVAGDFDGDSLADLAVVSASDQECPLRFKKLLLLFGDGKGGFARTRTVNTMILPRVMLAGDLNADGRSDLIFTDACTSSRGTYVMLGTKDGLGSLSLQNNNANALSLGDFNGDGRLDVAAIQVNNLAILTGKGDGGLNAASITTLSTFFSMFAFGDFNQDGATDGVIVGAGAGHVTPLLSRSSCAPASSVTTVSAASFAPIKLAAESIAAGFGVNFTESVEVAATIPLPTTLGGVSLTIKDSTGVERNAPLFFVSPGQINYQIPPNTAPGIAVVSVLKNGVMAVDGTIEIKPVAPGVFTANSSGFDFPAAVVLRVKADGTQTSEPVARFDVQQSKFVAIPIDLSDPAEQVFLSLYGTGLRNRSALSAVTVQIGGENAEVPFAGAQGNFVGLDQVNVRLPRSLAGRGDVDVVLTVDGKTANLVKIHIQ